MNNQKKKIVEDNNSQKINNIMAAMIMCFNLINGAIGIESVSYLTIACVFVLFAWGMVNRKTIIYVNQLLIVVYVLFAFVFSFLRVPDTQYTWYYFKYFFGFCMLALFIGCQSISISKVIEYVQKIGFVCVIVFIFRGIENYDPSLQMGIAYSILPVLYASVINLIYGDGLKMLSIINIAGVVYCYFNYAPRGILLNIGITILIYAFISLGKNKPKNERFAIRSVIAVLISVTIFLGVTYLKSILMWINYFSSSVFGTEINAVGKALFLLSIGDLGNGRGALLDLAKSLAKDNFIFGHGIGYFESIQGGGGHVHNIVFQTICEAGVFFLAPLFFIIWKAFNKLLYVRTEKNKQIRTAFFLLLFTNGIVTLFYSSVYWQLLIFWFLLGYMTNNRNQYC